MPRTDGVSAARRPHHGATIAVRVLAPGWRRDLPSAVSVARHAAAAAVDAVWPSLNPATPAELAVVLADAVMVRALNRSFRGIDRPTNVLSFGDGDDRYHTAPDETANLGDVILSHETVAAEAAAQGKTVTAHASHLIVHGVLHLLGFDHRRARDARVMERLETKILAELDIADPYADRLATRRPRP